MKFKYKKLSPTIFRPIIPINLSFGEKKIKYEALVDVGADRSVFDAKVGEWLGFDIKSGKLGTVSGLEGGKQKLYYHDVDIKVGGHKYTVPIGFMPNFKSAYSILGQILDKLVFLICSALNLIILKSRLN